MFLRPLVFTTENGRRKHVTLQRRGEINIKSKDLQNRYTSQSGLIGQVAVQTSDLK